MKSIELRGARTHNLKSVDLSIPREKLVVITGISGSGKSSLAFDTLYAEGQRRYVESLSTYARQFLSVMEKPDIDYIEGLSPAISIEQKSGSHNPRSTVGTVTEIYDYLRLLYARVGTPHCPLHGEPLQAQTVTSMVRQLLQQPDEERLMLLAPMVQNRKGEHLHLVNQLKQDGFVRARINGLVVELDDAPPLDRNRAHTIEVVVDRFRVRSSAATRLADSLETALNLSDGLALVSFLDQERGDLLFSSRFACPVCGHSLGKLEPRMFSFNNPAGACTECDGLGYRQFFDEEKLIRDSQLSLSEGAVRGWNRRNVYYYQMLISLAGHFGFDIDEPFASLPEKIRQVILYGSGSEKVQFRYLNDMGDEHVRSHPFEGIVPNMNRRYQETDSEVIRESLGKFLSIRECSGCLGSRLNADARSVLINDRAVQDLVGLSIADALEYFRDLRLDGNKGEVAEKILKEIHGRLTFLNDVGLSYLSLARSAETLSGGESQRIRLASQISGALVGVMYILDEPSIGLHQRDNQKLLRTLQRLRNLGNSVLVVEHDEEAIRAADWIVDMGPGAGIHGGEVVVSGELETVINCERSITGRYLRRTASIALPDFRHKPDPNQQLLLSEARGNNLQCLDLQIPLGLFTCVTGVSGSGKSTLIYGTLYPLAAQNLNGKSVDAAPSAGILGLEQLNKVIDIDQNPIGRTPRSNPATYTNIFSAIRELFAATREARSRGYKPGRFSFNVKGGRCEACQGDGLIKVEMHFLPDVYVACDECRGQRYSQETLEIRYKGKNIHEVLKMTVEDALEFFAAVPVIHRRLSTLMDVGLSYIQLGQPANTLSGGEAQRIKLARELAKRDTGRTLYILDEPTTGLHFHDIAQLLKVLHQLRDQGNTIVVIEHNLDVIKTADWVVDLGPEGGAAGGRIVTAGTPEEVAACAESFTGQFLAPLLVSPDCAQARKAGEA